MRVTMAHFTVTCSTCGNKFENEQLCISESDRCEFEHKMQNAKGTCKTCFNKEYREFLESECCFERATRYK